MSSGGGNNGFITSTIDEPLLIDLSQPFTILGWLRTTDTIDWRTFISFESPNCKTSLLNIALVPGSMAVHYGYMRDAQSRHTVNTTLVVPGPNLYFHFALTVANNGATFYVDGRKKLVQTFNPIFNPADKRVILGRTKYENFNTAQWNGQIRDAKVFQRLLTEQEIQQASDDARRRP